MFRFVSTTLAAVLLLGCGGSTTTPTPQRVVQNLDYTLRLTPNLWPISGPEFDSRNGVIDVVARVDSPVAVVYAIDLLYVGTTVPHNEGSGGVTARGPGPMLSAQWNVGFSGRYQARIFPVIQAPLPVPATGVNVPVTFTVTHP
jgi:hypothetical protein